MQVTLERLGISIAVVGLGITVSLSGIANSIEYVNKDRAMHEYASMLSSEVELNITQAEIVISQHEKGQPLTLIPAYKSTVYEAGIGTDGYFYALDSDSQKLVQAFHAIASTDEKSIESLSEQPEIKEKALYGQALAIKSGFSRFQNNFSINNFYYIPAIFNLGIVLFGLLFIFAGARLLEPQKTKSNFLTEIAKLFGIEPKR